MKVGIIELLGDILNVHGKVGDIDVIIKMPNKYEIKQNDVIKVAIEQSYERFFNETTTKAITPDYCEYEEIEVTQSLDEDNVTIIEQKKQGIISKAVGFIKSKIKHDGEKEEGKKDGKEPENKEESDKK